MAGVQEPVDESRLRAGNPIPCPAECDRSRSLMTRKVQVPGRPPRKGQSASLSRIVGRPDPLIGLPEATHEASARFGFSCGAALRGWLF